MQDNVQVDCEANSMQDNVQVDCDANSMQDNVQVDCETKSMLGQRTGRWGDQKHAKTPYRQIVRLTVCKDTVQVVCQTDYM